ncbi:hypothetical protein [Luteolibacter sp. LG18]|uniref:hypothetical protein n=1 Tax=Luteolibacter sp. LG18 TaxID=2819286 RepID=UPI002B2A8DE6|nr:hypothetical protein llg_13560 [Luteolibacter sp. LG18]
MRLIATAALLPTLAAAAPPAGEITLELKPFTIERTLAATALPPAPMVLKLEAEGWPAFELDSIAAHGSRVNAGDVLVSFDTKALDRKLEDARKALDSAVLTLGQSETELRSLKDNYTLRADAAKRAARNAADDLAYFSNTSRKSQEERSNEALKRSKQQLENAREELRQLEKMYKADDLTEDTEEIILVRQRDAVASAEFMVRMAEQDNRRILDTTLPRQAEDFDAGARSASLALGKSEVDLPRQIQLKEIEVANAKTLLGRQKDDLAKLEDARKTAEPIKAPAAGWFYHGVIEDGRWTTGEAVKTLIPHGSVAARRGFATFIPAGTPLGLVAFADEATARSLPKDATGAATLPGREDLAATATVKQVADTPGTDGRYRVDLAGNWPAEAPPVPGATAQVRIISYENPSAIALPVSALKASKDGWTVTVKLADGKTAPRPVKRGRVSGEQTEILSGLEAGQVVVP